MTKQIPVPATAITTPAIAGLDHARAVEEARVERDRVRQRARSDHLVGQRLATRCVEGERDAAERGEHVDHREGRGTGQGDHGERDGHDQCDALRRHHELARVDAVGHDSGRQPEDGERHEPPEDEGAHCERRSGRARARARRARRSASTSPRGRRAARRRRSGSRCLERLRNVRVLSAIASEVTRLRRGGAEAPESRLRRSRAHWVRGLAGGRRARWFDEHGCAA